MTVVLDTNLTPELIEEGFVREMISKIQTMRKEAGFEVMDQIVVYADKITIKICDDLISNTRMRSKVKSLADNIILGEMARVTPRSGTSTARMYDSGSMQNE